MRQSVADRIHPRNTRLAARAASGSRPDLRALTSVFLRIGWLSFGGPAAQPAIATLEWRVVALSLLSAVLFLRLRAGIGDTLAASAPAALDQITLV